jgi:C-terminal processing protease CtpA/Prc
MQYSTDCKALYIKIPSFHYELVDRDSNIVYEGLKKYPEAENIIFDITTNGGGSDGYWMENLVAPFGGTYEFGYRSFFKSTPLINKYYADSESKPVSELSDAPEWASELGLDRYYTDTWTLSEEDFDGEIIDRDIKKWVLISNRVYSASEKFVCFCKATGWATLVGTKTSGDGLGPTPVMLLLPDSGLLIRFSGNVGENPDGSINAVTGTKPDITCQKKETPLERCLEEIRGIIK